MNKVQQSLMDLSMPAGMAKIEKVVLDYQVFQTFLAAVNLGLFDYLVEKGAADRKVISEGIGINGMFSRSFLDTLVEIGLLLKQNENYQNSDIANDFLVSSSPFYQGDWVKNTGRGNHWGNLEESLKREKPEIKNTGSGPGESFLSSLAETSLRGELQAVTKTIAGWNGFGKAKSLLDLGGGHGLYAIALCQANPNLKGVVFDKPEVTQITQKYIEKYQMSSRMSTRGGDICSDSFGSGFDIVIVSHLLYKFRKELEPFFDKVYKALNPGGLLVTNHWFCAPGCTAEGSSVKELAKSLQSFGHPLCHIEDFYKVFENKGFELIVKSDIPSAHGTSCLQLAVKGEGGKNASGGSCGCC
jgi:SAM-dependent methyltransferase